MEREKVQIYFLKKKRSRTLHVLRSQRKKKCPLEVSDLSPTTEVLRELTCEQSQPLSSSNDLDYVNMREDIKREDPGISWDQINQEISSHAIEIPTLRGDIKREDSNAVPVIKSEPNCEILEISTDNCNSSAVPIIKSEHNNEVLKINSDKYNSCTLPVTETEINNEVSIDFPNSIEAAEAESVCKHMSSLNDLSYATMKEDIKREDPGKSWDQIKQEISSHAIEIPTLAGDIKREDFNAIPVIKSEKIC